MLSVRTQQKLELLELTVLIHKMYYMYVNTSLQCNLNTYTLEYCNAIIMFNFIILYYYNYVELN